MARARVVDLGLGVLRPVVAVLIALVAGAILIQLSGNDAFSAYQQLLYGALGDSFNLAESLRIATTILFTSLAFTVALRCGVFNAGTQGQFVMGAFTAALVGFSFPALPSMVIIPLGFAAGMLAGGVWSGIPGALKEKWGVSEIITTLMMTFIAVLLADYLTATRFRDISSGGQDIATPFISSAARLYQLIPTTHLTWALFLGIGIILLYGVFLRRSVLGYEFEMVGSNLAVAAYGGISVRKVRFIAMLISGMIAGLGGAQDIFSVNYQYISRFSPEVGFSGIVASLLGRNKPLGIISAAILLGGLQNGGLVMQLFTNVDRNAVSVITALMILLAAATTWPWMGPLQKWLRLARSQPAPALGSLVAREIVSRNSGVTDGKVESSVSEYTGSLAETAGDPPEASDA